MSREESFAARIEVLKRAASDKNADAQFLVGTAYAQGQGAPASDREAAKWFHQASKGGHVRAMTSLGFMYAKGRGVRRDLILAYQYLSQGAEHGDGLARDLLARVRREMSPPQLKDAERRVMQKRLG